MNQASPADSAPRPTLWSKFVRWFPLGVVAFEAITLGVLLILANQEKVLAPAESGLAMKATVALGTILLLLWFVFLSPVSSNVRRPVGLVVALLTVLAIAAVRVEGVSGDIGLHLNWRWAPRADETLPTAASEATAAPAVDLTQITESDYPAFLGRERLATIKNLHLARDWKATPPKLLWRHPIGAGWSGFAVVGHYGVTQEQRAEEELITCYNLDDGKLQWAHVTPVRFHELIAGIGPRATPTIDEGKVYAMGAMGDLHCLDGATGKVIWSHNVIFDTGAPPPQWGKSCSPLIYQNLVIVSAGGPKGQSLVAYDKLDGKTVWSAGDDASSYSSPTLLTLCGQPQIVIVNQKLTSGHDPADGHMLWEHVWPEGGVASPNVAQPLAVGDDRLLLTKGYGIGSTLWQITHVDGKWSVEPVWKNNSMKTKMTSAVLRDGFAYGLDEGTLSCVEAATGKKKWKKTKFGHGQVLLIDDLLLVQSEDGQVALVDASPEGYKELARATLVNGQSWNYPAIAGRKLIVRTEQEVACYELPVVSP